jgi:hypothetical protein
MVVVSLLMVAQSGSVASNGEERKTKEKEIVVLLFSSIFLFFYSFPLLKSSLLCSSLFSAPLVLKQTSHFVFSQL